MAATPPPRARTANDAAPRRAPRAGRALPARGGLGLAERAGVLTAVAAVGQTYSRGLLPRSTVDQGLITGISTGAHYSCVTLAASVIESAAVAAAGRLPGDPARTVPAAAFALNAGTAAAAFTARSALPLRPSEPLARAGTRTALSWLGAAGAAACVVQGLDSAVALLDGGRRGPATKLPVGFVAGATFATLQYARMRRTMGEAHGATPSPRVTDSAEPTSTSRGAPAPRAAVGRSLAVGSVVAAGAFAGAQAERVVAGAAGRAVTAAVPGTAGYARPIGHALAIGGLGMVASRRMRRLLRRAEQAVAAVESAYRTPPTNPRVSGGPASAVDFDRLGRDGCRFVNMAMTAAEISAVTGGAAAGESPDTTDPVRIFIGLGSAPTASARVELAIDEMDRLGAFERHTILLVAPTATGAVDDVAVEAVECLTGGDVATVAMQYASVPALWTIGRLSTAVQQHELLLTALKWRIQALPAEARPRVLVFGESVGAKTVQDTVGDGDAADLLRAGVDRALFVGTPYQSRWRQRWQADPTAADPAGRVVEVAGADAWADLPAARRAAARITLLTHHDDPVPKFWFPLAVQQPAWMGPAETREPGLPTETRWHPVTTFLITLFDVKNARRIIPGQFEARGHDYRRDLVPMVAAALDLPADVATLDRIATALAAREQRWAERRVVDEQVTAAVAQARAQLARWGVPEERVDAMIAAVQDAAGVPDVA